MGKTEFILLDSREHPLWDKVPGLLRRMYGQMKAMGLTLPMVEEGEDKWLGTARNTAGKFGIVVLAMDEENAVGFAHGSLKFLPDYLGGHLVGSITHVFVSDEKRKTGLGENLVKILEEWFRDKKVHSIELQVIAGNAGGKAFWEKLGYLEELTQYRKS